MQGSVPKSQTMSVTFPWPDKYSSLYANILFFIGGNNINNLNRNKTNKRTNKKAKTRTVYTHTHHILFTFVIFGLGQLGANDVADIARSFLDKLDDGSVLTQLLQRFREILWLQLWSVLVQGRFGDDQFTLQIANQVILELSVNFSFTSFFPETKRLIPFLFYLHLFCSVLHPF